MAISTSSLVSFIDLDPWSDNLDSIVNFVFVPETNTVWIDSRDLDKYSDEYTDPDEFQSVFDVICDRIIYELEKTGIEHNEVAFYPRLV